MGRTNPTYRDAVASLESEWGPMRRALRREYQGDFDRLFGRARNFADAAGHANAPDPERALLLSLLLAHEVEHRRVRDRFAERETRLAETEAQLAETETRLAETASRLEALEAAVASGPAGTDASDDAGGPAGTAELDDASKSADTTGSNAASASNGTAEDIEAREECS